MEMENILKTIIHPELGVDIVSLGMVGDVKQSADAISLTIKMPKAHDHASGSIRRAVEKALGDATGKTITVIVSEPKPENKKEQAQQQMRQNSGASGVKKVVGISSGKGGVGKSSVTANLAIALKNLGFKVGILDADIYGPSMPKMFGLEGFVPLSEDENSEIILPAMSFGIKVMSIGFFIEADKALVWRGPMATSALRQMVHQTQWGELDFLLLDLPPGTGDVHLTITTEIKIDSAVIVTTPQAVALVDVVRGIALFRNENVNVPVVGMVENMSYFSPSDMPNKKYYIFGRGKSEAVAKATGLDIVASIPIDEKICECGDDGKPYCEIYPKSQIAASFEVLAKLL